MLIFTAIIDLLSPSANSNFNTCRIRVILHTKVQFQLGANCVESDSTKVMLFHFKVREYSNNVNFIKFIALDLVIGNGTYGTLGNKK